MDWNIENGYFADGVKIIAGTDEAGRGPLCGPVVAGACILPAGIELPYLNDSKKLTEKRREALYTLITEQAVYEFCDECQAQLKEWLKNEKEK